MTGILKIIKPGINTTIQDHGRLGYQKYGISTSGVMDKFLATVTNALVGNDYNAAVLEMAYIGVVIEVVDGRAQIAIGGKVDVEVLSDNNFYPRPFNSFEVKKGDVIKINAINSSVYAYLAIYGGFDVKKLFGSSSTHTISSLGGHLGRKLEKNDLLNFKTLDKELSNKKLTKNFFYKVDSFSVVLGPQSSLFTNESIEKFLSTDYKITTSTDRMGLRLSGCKLYHKGKVDIDSEGVIPGCIQVPGNGNPIILMSDHPSVGGYAKIATVISSDLSRLGQLLPGSIINFNKVTLEEAISRKKQFDHYVDEVISSIL